MFCIIFVSIPPRATVCTRTYSHMISHGSCCDRNTKGKLILLINRCTTDQPTDTRTTTTELGWSVCLGFYFFFCFLLFFISFKENAEGGSGEGARYGRYHHHRHNHEKVLVASVGWRCRCYSLGTFISAFLVKCNNAVVGLPL